MKTEKLFVPVNCTRRNTIRSPLVAEKVHESVSPTDEMLPS